MYEQNHYINKFKINISCYIYIYIYIIYKIRNFLFPILPIIEKFAFDSLYTPLYI